MRNYLLSFYAYLKLFLHEKFNTRNRTKDLKDNFE